MVSVIIDVEFQVGDLVALINLAKEDIIAISMVCGQTCLHCGTPIENERYWMQFEQIVKDKNEIPLLVTNENDDVFGHGFH